MRNRFLTGTFFLTLAFLAGRSAQAATSTTHTALQMADGRFYDPASGRSADTRAQLFPDEVVVSVQNSSTTTTSLPETATTTPAIPESPMSLAVARGKVLLVENQLMTATKATTVADWRVVDLAIWTPETNVIERVRIKKKGSSLQQVGSSDYTIAVRTSNGLESTYDVASKTQPTTTPKVVAIRYPLFHPVAGKKKRFDIEEVIYTPYATSLHTPELVARGKAYLDQQLRLVYQDLEQKKIPSRVTSGKLVTEVIRPEVVKAILLIEHTDKKSLEQQPKQTVERFYLNFGLNESIAYAYEESQVGALGAPQFMESTYKLMTRQTALDLDTNFIRGMRDLRNGMTAEVVYLDRLLAVMPEEVQTQHEDHPFDAGAYIVAAYNGGETRIKRAFATLGEEWDASQAAQQAVLDKKVTKLKADVAAFKKKLATKAVKKSATETKAVKKSLATAQANLENATSQADELRKASLRPETVGYLQKYHLALPFLADTGTATTTPSGTNAPAMIPMPNISNSGLPEGATTTPAVSAATVSS